MPPRSTVRGRSATALACLVEALGIYSRLPSGYNRDLQLVKAPLRARTNWSSGEGMPFREACRRVAAEMANEEGDGKS